MPFKQLRDPAKDELIAEYRQAIQKIRDAVLKYPDIDNFHVNAILDIIDEYTPDCSE